MGKCVTFWYVLAAGVLFLLWWLIALFTALPIIPSPVLVLENLTDIFVKYIAVHGAYSLWRIAAGLFLAVALSCFPS